MMAVPQLRFYTVWVKKSDHFTLLSKNKDI